MRQYDFRKSWSILLVSELSQTLKSVPNVRKTIVLKSSDLDQTMFWSVPELDFPIPAGAALPLASATHARCAAGTPRSHAMRGARVPEGANSEVLTARRLVLDSPSQNAHL